jgi:hypothetical protein
MYTLTQNALFKTLQLKCTDEAKANSYLYDFTHLFYQYAFSRKCYIEEEDIFDTFYIKSFMNK